MEREQAVKFMNDLLKLMLSKKGSDLFLTSALRLRSRSTAK
jgi:twitching motility protein PilU